MTVKEIIEKYLSDNGFDGLTCEDCSCSKDDIMPCGSEYMSRCEPGYKIECSGCGDYDYCISKGKGDLCNND